MYACPPLLSPSHTQVGCPIILLRNLSPRQGLANGTRLIVVELGRHVIKAKIMTGSDDHIGKVVFIPRIPMIPSDPQLPIVFKRLQFPIRPAFAMSINKAQGQTFSTVGVFLPQSCFTHGQLYVAMSRVGEAKGVRIMVLNIKEGEEASTDNVVYNEIFR
jgi:ATP-dependent DNA helicase PIF1